MKIPQNKSNQGGDWPLLQKLQNTQAKLKKMLEERKNKQTNKNTLIDWKNQ